MPCSEQKQAIESFVSRRPLNLRISTNSRKVPIKLVPLSLQTTQGLPRQAINLCRVTTKASEVKSNTGSRWRAFTVKRDKYANVSLGDNGSLQTYPDLTKRLDQHSRCLHCRKQVLVSIDRLVVAWVIVGVVFPVHGGKSRTYSRRQKWFRFVIVVRSYYVCTTATLQCERWTYVLRSVKFPCVTAAQSVLFPHHICTHTYCVITLYILLPKISPKKNTKLWAEHVDRTALVLDHCSVQEHREYSSTNFD